MTLSRLYRNSLLFSLALTAFLLVGCSDSTIAGAESDTAEWAAVSAVPDLSGTWMWSEVTLIKGRAFAVEATFGGAIVPEGPITHLTCPSSGVLTVAQAGSTFTGSSTQAPATCTTRGGQVAPAPFPPFLDLVDGEIHGRSFRFTFGTGGPACHYRGAIRVEDGVAVALNGTASCDIPNDFGNDKILDFTATRM